MTASVDPLTDELAQMLVAFVIGGGIDGPTLGALAVLGHPEIHEALKAAEVLTRLREAHRWVTHEGSTWRACSCGVAGCRAPELLEGP